MTLSSGGTGGRSSREDDIGDVELVCAERVFINSLERDPLFQIWTWRVSLASDVTLYLQFLHYSAP